MNNKRCFSLDNDIVYISNESGLEVHLTKQDFLIYCPEIDLSGKTYICYIPVFGINEDKTRTEKDLDMTPQYEYVINNIEKIIEKMKDIFYGLDLDGCKKVLIQKVKNMPARIITEKYPLWKQLNIINEGPQELRDQMTADINSIRDASNKMEEEINALKKIEKVKDYDIEFPTI